jgi:hypothetical protein
MRLQRLVLVLLPLALAPGCVLSGGVSAAHGHGYGPDYGPRPYAYGPPRYWGPAPYYAPKPYAYAPRSYYAPRPYYAPPPAWHRPHPHWHDRPRSHRW